MTMLRKLLDTISRLEENFDMVAEAPAGKVVEVPLNNFLLKYREPKNKNAPVEWVIYSKANNLVHQGNSASAQAAVDEARRWINTQLDQEMKLDRRSVIDFNAEFCQEFAPDGEKFYATIEDGYLMLSFEPRQGFKPSHLRVVGQAFFQSISLSDAEAADTGLVANGRYTLGPREELEPGVYLFSLNYQGRVADPTDRMRLGEPGFTVATQRTAPR